MDGILSDVVIVALVGLAGGLATTISSRASSRDQVRLSVLDVTVQRLAERVTALEASLASAEEQRDRAEEEARTQRQRSWALADYAAALLWWGRSMARRLTDPPEEPPAPSFFDGDVGH